MHEDILRNYHVGVSCQSEMVEVLPTILTAGKLFNEVSHW